MPPRPRGAGPTGPRADFGARLVGFIIDSVILGIANAIVREGTSPAVALLLGIVIQAAYAVYFIASGSGQTPGMRIMKIRAVDAATGGRVEPRKALVRWLMSIVSGAALAIGYLWMLWDPEKQTWHDKAAGTFVVPTDAYPVDQWPG